jgi:3-deoxy-D-manno-octulosonic-acid transferase
MEWLLWVYDWFWFLLLIVYALYIIYRSADNIASSYWQHEQEENKKYEKFLSNKNKYQKSIDKG